MRHTHDLDGRRGGPPATRPLRVDLVSEHASPLAVLGGTDAGGQNVHVAALARALAARGHRVVVHTRRDDPRAPETVPFADGVDVVHSFAGPPRPLPKDDLLPHMRRFGDELARRWRDDGVPDVVHAHFWMSAVAVRHAVRRLREEHLAAPVTVVTFHALGAVKRRFQGGADTSPPDRLDVERELLHDLDGVVATCRDEVRELLGSGAEAERLHVVPCGVDVARFAPDGPADGPWRPGTARLLSLGRLVERKGVDTVVAALARLPHAELVVAGGPDASGLSDDPDVRRLRATAAAHGVAERVHVVGRVDQGGAARLLRAADVLVTVPWYEPFGIVPLEAMACGTPVVASAVGGMLDTVVDVEDDPVDGTGALVPPRDPHALAERIGRLLEDPALLRRAGAAGVDRARRAFTWESVAERTEQVYAGLVGGAPGRGPAEEAEDVLVLPSGPIGPPATATTPATTPTTTSTAAPAAKAGFGTVREHVADLSLAVDSLVAQEAEIERWGRRLAACLDGGRLLVAGNGGSAAEAQHLTAELVGRFEGERRPLSAIPLHGDTSTVTAVGNDYGGDEVFARQVEAHGRPGDVVLLLSTSGRSPNVLRAAARARERGLEVWAMTGALPNPLAAIADRTLAVGGRSTSAVQEGHLVAVHAVCAAVERHLASAERSRVVDLRPSAEVAG
ncbi:glycosyltransferase [Aquipuribacter nitratireducens]|uniref:Glycosyltransferase n=1 Tax=Aquipuribacter nitratireducens TaxID=650104 RepID=A0ABW0GKK7_9MICO